MDAKRPVPSLRQVASLIVRKDFFLAVAAAYILVSFLLARRDGFLGSQFKVSELSPVCHAKQPEGMRYGCKVKPNRGELAGSDWNESLNFRSQYNEDRHLVESFFFGVRGGSFLEMGALDGLRFSNTKFFEADMGWSGLLIEGSPTNYEKLIRNRNQSICVNALVCDSPGKVHLIEHGAVGGAYELMSERFKKSWHPNVDLSKHPEVPCIPMSSILDGIGIRHVDFFSLDVEGAEAQVLSTIDFEKFSASVIVMEFSETPSYQKALSYFLDAGYIRLPNNRMSNERPYWATNVAIVHPDFKAQLDRL